MNAFSKVLLFATATLTLSCAAPGGPYSEPYSIIVTDMAPQVTQRTLQLETKRAARAIT
jgi:hypothetical protein